MVSVFSGDSLCREQGEMGWEMHAYDNMGVDYFYLGDMEKCNYYHDRIVRGKFESEDSVLKSVTVSTIRSKREVYHSGKRKNFNKDVSMKEDQKRKTDFGLSKSIMLLPFYAGPEVTASTQQVQSEAGKTGTAAASAAAGASKGGDQQKAEPSYLRSTVSRIKKRYSWLLFSLVGLCTSRAGAISGAGARCRASASRRRLTGSRSPRSATRR